MCLPEVPRDIGCLVERGREKEKRRRLRERRRYIETRYEILVFYEFTHMNSKQI